MTAGTTPARALTDDITGWQVLLRVAAQYSVDGGVTWHDYDADGGIILADNELEPPAGERPPGQ